MKVPNDAQDLKKVAISLSRLQNEGSQPVMRISVRITKSIKATE